MRRLFLLFPFALLACTHQAPHDGDIDGGLEDIDANVPDAFSADGPPDGVAHHGTCVNSFGNGLTTVHGRIDGVLTSLVRSNASGCRADSDHVHLQITMNSAVYDVAVTIVDNAGAQVFFAERDLPMPGDPWNEGWHPIAQLDYVALGLHSTDFTATAKATLEQTILTALNTANHISVYMSPYDNSGGHLVHRNGFGNDGAIIIRPLSGTPHLLLFHFADQTF